MIGGPRSSDRVRALREALPASGAGIYLATHVAGPVPAETMAAVHESDDLELRIGRAGPDHDDDLEQREKEARAVVAAVIKASPERVLLLHGAPEAAAAVALEVLRSRDGSARLLLLDGLDDAVAAALRAVGEAAGVGVDAIAQAPQIISAEVALVAMAHVDVNGVLADVASVAVAAHKAGARLLLDAGLSVGALATDVEMLGADAVIADTRRWLLGPDAVALAWLAPALGEDLPARCRRSAGPIGRSTLLALARSVGWLLMYVELPWVIERTEELSDRLHEDLAAIDGVDLRAGRAAHGPVASFHIEGWEAKSAAEELSRSTFAIIEADSEADLLRASVGAWNREDELDRFVKRVAELARHTPESLPRKPSLTVISGPIDSEENE